MTEKRFTTDNGSHEDVCLVDNITGKEYESNFEDIVDLMNKLEKENRQLRLELDTHKHPLWGTREAERIVNELKEENEQLKQSIKEIDDAELHLKQIILKRIDDYIWEWEDEGTPVAQVLRELRDEIKGDVE